MGVNMISIILKVNQKSLIMNQITKQNNQKILITGSFSDKVDCVSAEGSTFSAALCSAFSLARAEFCSLLGSI
jgi:hypothetical protein